MRLRWNRPEPSTNYDAPADGIAVNSIADSQPIAHPDSDARAHSEA